MFPRCAPNMASRQRSASGSSVTRRPIAADARFMSNGSCPPNARTSVSRRTGAMDAASTPGAGIEMTQANAPRGVPAGPADKKPRLPILPMSIPIGRNVWRSLTGNSLRKTAGARLETRIARYGAATKRTSVPMVRARQDPTQSQGVADQRAAQNHRATARPEDAADPQKGALAANRDAPCVLSAAG